METRIPKTYRMTQDALSKLDDMKAKGKAKDSTEAVLMAIDLAYKSHRATGKAGERKVLIVAKTL